MTVKTFNRSRRVVYLVVLLVFAAALTTALFLAGEPRPRGSTSSTLQTDTIPALRAPSLWGRNNV